ncbi:DUF1906 domain-containing protein [Streptomyces sp. NPDC000594]|uniref:DUF1906 domain-containing protein n=1 Tax=Streptomyces sp. NPDC000594 TaxID=3154261 RepID=UPI003331E57F
MRTRSRAPRSTTAAALVLTALLGASDLLFAPQGPPEGAAYSSTSATGGRLSPGERRPPGRVPDTTADTAVTFRGLAFDLCRAPSLAVMRAWRTSSPYGAVGVPFAGRGGECPGPARGGPRLTRAWVTEVHRMGWRLFPVYAGARPPCSASGDSATGDSATGESGARSGAGREGSGREGVGSEGIGRDGVGKDGVGKDGVGKDGATIGGDGGTPAAQGGRDGTDAVRAARALGMIHGSALYVSLKSYDLRDSSCVRATLDYVRAWNREIRRHGYVPGLRSHADAGVLHMEHARRAGTGDLPSAMWFARWNRRPSLYDERALHPYAWRVKRRIHQYAGEVTEEHGGHRLTVGRSLADAPVARFGR